MAERASPPLRTALQLNLLTSLATVLARRLSGFIKAADVTLLSCTKPLSINLQWSLSWTVDHHCKAITCLCGG